MRDPKRVTLNDVAAASGVSRATASFVLRDSPNQSISAATSERVRQAARDLGYVPHAIARALREGSSRIVVLSLDVALDGNYARSYVRGLDAELAAHDHALLVRYEHAGAEAALDAIAPRAVLRFGEPYLTGHELEDSGGGWRDGLAAHVSAQVGYLAGRGHTRIAYALPDPDTPLRAVRLRFADRAAERLGLSPVAPFSIPVFRTGAAYSMAEIRAARPAVTAVAAFDDDVALRVLAAMRDLGLAAPGDLAVIGFDDNGYGALATPALTTVHIDAEAHGRQAARAILGLDAGDLSPAPGRVVVRESA
ncbi:MAG TPA: LacI family DNA-binding transcriptional regulator [Trebonia sp.]|nr:LacI family DNA-binding transcriptional regulator [Trebonia sp.]